MAFPSLSELTSNLIKKEAAVEPENGNMAVSPAQIKPTSFADLRTVMANTPASPHYDDTKNASLTPKNLLKTSELPDSDLGLLPEPGDAVTEAPSNDANTAKQPEIPAPYGSDDEKRPIGFPITVAVAEAEPSKEVTVGSDGLEEIKNESLTGRPLVKKFLEEISMLTQAAEKYSTLIETRKARAETGTKEIAVKKELLTDGNNIKTAMELLLSNIENETVREKLMGSLTAHNNYLDAHRDEISSFETSESKKDNALLLEINAQKKSIDELTKIIGGKERFENFRKTIKSLERIAGRYINKMFVGQSEKPKSKELMTYCVERILNFTERDLDIAKAATGKGDIMTVLLAIFSATIEKIQQKPE